MPTLVFNSTLPDNARLIRAIIKEREGALKVLRRVHDALTVLPLEPGKPDRIGKYNFGNDADVEMETLRHFFGKPSIETSDGDSMIIYIHGTQALQARIAYFAWEE
jgi:hypothetical protein